jgi:hypothetical protein
LKLGHRYNCINGEFMTDPDTLFCANHPDRETLLRCNRCEKPICMQCAVQTPTGYRCRECVRGQQKVFNTARPADVIIAPLIAAVISFIGANFVSFLGFFTLFVAPFAGMLIERVLRLVIKNRRSNALFLSAAAGSALGALPVFLVSLLSFLQSLAMGSFNIYGLLPLIWRGAYLVMVTSAVYYRLKGISFK